MSSPVYREKAEKINTLLAKRYKDHPALLLWHLSNEYSGECHCELCQNKFREWLKEKYQTIENLNAAWWTSFWAHTYSEWDEIESPSSKGELFLHGQTLDWKRFTTDLTIEFMEAEAAPIRKITPKTPVTTNLMGTYPGLDYFKLAKHLDIVSWDSYPQWKGTHEDIREAAKAAFNHDLMRGVAGQRPFMLMESSPSATNWLEINKLRRPGGHALYSMQAVAHGSDSVQYFQFRKSRGSCEKFHGAVVDHVGNENTRVFREVTDIGCTLGKLDEVLGTRVPSKAAIVFDWENRWALEDCKGMQQEKKYEETVIDHYQALWQLGVSMDVIDQCSELDGYQLVVAPMCYMLKPSFANEIKRFVKDGGKAVFTYMSGYVNETDLCFLGGFPGPLKEVLGIWNEEIDALYPEDNNAITFNGESYRAFDLCEIIHAGQDTTILGEYKNDFYIGKPVVTEHQFGSGKGYYIAARTGVDFLTDFYRTFGMKSSLEAMLPAGVSATVRRVGETDYVFLMNFLNKDQGVFVSEGGISLLTGHAVSGDIELPALGFEVYKRKRVE